MYTWSNSQLCDNMQDKKGKHPYIMVLRIHSWVEYSVGVRTHGIMSQLEEHIISVRSLLHECKQETYGRHFEIAKCTWAGHTFQKNFHTGVVEGL